MNKRKGILALLAGGIIGLASPTIMSFLGKWEGEGQYVVYEDKLAGGLPTVCKGITKWTSPYPVVVGERWSPEKCAEVETHVTVQTQMKLAECITNENISQEVFEALTSHAHNFGVNRTCGSRAVSLINAGEIVKGCDAIAHSPSGTPVWSYAGGKFYRGLYNRRLDERKLCLSGLK